MIRMIQRRLIIPRGDTGSFSIPYLKTISPGDVAVFTIFDIRTKTKMYQKLIAAEGDILNIAFTHGDTVNLKPGKYLWDIKFYTNPQIIDDELVNGDEVDSYYAGFSLPECEIRETGDTLLTSDDAPTSTISPESLNIINAAINEILNTKRAAVEAAETASLKADAAAESAEDASDSAAAASQSAALAEARVNEIESLSVEVNTGLEGTDASVTYTPSTGVLSFIIPRGNTGNGIASCVLNDDFTLTINYTNGDSTTTIPIRGDTPHLTIGEVTEGPNAIATITGTDANPILNLTLPNANVPTRVSQLENDSGYLTEHQDLSNYVQKTDYATSHEAGIVKIGAGLTIDGSFLTLYKASNNQIKQGTASYSPIVPSIQERSTFYGLAKAAGDTTQSQSSNAVGAYTDEAKAAIQQMLDVPSNADIPTQVSQLTNDAGYLTSFTETDPTVPAWAKAAQKPSYTAAEVGAPTVAEMNTAIGTAIGQVNSFDIAVVQELPTQDISTHTIYLVPKTGETNDVYDEYVYINNAWEMVGNTQIDLSNYVQKTDYANQTTGGVVKVINNGGGGFQIDQGYLLVNPATNNSIKTGNVSVLTPIVPGNQHTSAFYGLAKAAGDTTQSASSNAVGTYTDEAKVAIQQMLDVPSNMDVPVESGTGIGSIKTKAFEYSGVTFTNTASGVASFAKGISTTASGNYSHAEGNTSTASGTASHAEGRSTASGNYAHSEGIDTKSEGNFSHAEGRLSIAHGTYSHAEGYNTLADSISSHAEGSNTTAFGSYSHVEGISNVAKGACSHVSGKYNVLDSYISWPEWAPGNEYAIRDRVKITSTVDNETIVTGYICKTANSDVEFTVENWTKDFYYNNAEIIGNGSGANARSNAYALDWTGDGHYAGDVYVHANADSTGGTKLATIEDIPDVPVQDVQVNGASIVQDGVANVPVATKPLLPNNPGAFGVVRIGNFGVTTYNDTLCLDTPTDSMLKQGTTRDRAITVFCQEKATFYGLAKAAGADMKDIVNTTVGTYPDAQKEAIQSMLGITQMLAPENPNLVATQAYAIGDVFAANGHLYKATAAIAQDEAIIPDTNCVETTMVDAGGKIKDVQVNGASVVGSDGIAEIPIGGNHIFGVVKTNPNRGTAISSSFDNDLCIAAATVGQIQLGNDIFRPIVPARQHIATFYGLSKAAGVDIGDTNDTLSEYPEASKTAIKAMLGVEEGLKVVRLI